VCVCVCVRLLKKEGHVISRAEAAQV